MHRGSGLIRRLEVEDGNSIRHIYLLFSCVLLNRASSVQGYRYDFQDPFGFSNVIAIGVNSRAV